VLQTLPTKPSEWTPMQINGKLFVKACSIYRWRHPWSKTWTLETGNLRKPKKKLIDTRLTKSKEPNNSELCWVCSWFVTTLMWAMLPTFRTYTLHPSSRSKSGGWWICVYITVFWKRREVGQKEWGFVVPSLGQQGQWTGLCRRPLQEAQAYRSDFLC
jgi:hypothetical protein